jgi:hypothetical protein
VVPPNPERVFELVIDFLQFAAVRLRTLSEFGDFFVEISQGVALG